MNPASPELRKIPSVSALLQAATGAGVSADARLVRGVLDAVRAEVTAGAACPDEPALLARLAGEAATRSRREVRRVVNATGIALHTNLGRAPLPADAMARVTELVTGYCNLELDLATGQRGKRADGVKEMLRSITGAEDAALVNNGAAAVYLLLHALAAGKEVIVSRGELVQIGGGFRVPDILAASGARLVEVGTTNITTAADYARAVTENTALLLKVHRSNFHIAGHTEEASVAELADLARERGLTVALDLGSGSFVRWRGHDPAHEPTVQDALRAGADLVTFSGDKLVGGPQAGLVVGRAALVRTLAKHPLYRALRLGRLSTVALQEVLRYYVQGRHLELPAWAAIEMDDATHAARSEALQEALGRLGIPVALVEAETTVGGGAAPAHQFPTRLVALKPKDPTAFLAALRAGDPAVLPRVERDTVLLDVRTVAVAEEPLLIRAISAAWV